MTATADKSTLDELRDELRTVRELSEQRRRQLGGVNAANNRKSQRIKELEQQVQELRQFALKCMSQSCGKTVYGEPNPADCGGCEWWTEHGVYSHECELRSEADSLGVEL